jgi:hypothetical protein
MGPNYVLDKGFLVDASAVSADFKTARLVKYLASDTTGKTVTSFTAANVDAVGVLMETLDAAKVSTGKATVAVRMLGIARIEASAAIALGARVAATANGRIATGASTNPTVGIAMSTAAASGDHVDVLLTPGANFG